MLICGRLHALFSTQPLQRRTSRGMSQQSFADFVGVSIASIKRWELGFVQEPIYDKLIRQKCDSETIRCVFQSGVSLVTPRGIIAQGQFSISTHFIVNLSMPHFMAEPLIISPSLSGFTNRMTNEKECAETSKQWRKRHSNASDTSFIQQCH